MKASTTNIIWLSTLFMIVVSQSTNFAGGELTSIDYKEAYYGERCTPVFTGLVNKRNSITLLVDDSFRIAMKDADRALASMPSATLQITAYRANDENENVDHQRAEYIRKLVTSGTAGVTIDPNRIVAVDGGIPNKPELSGREVSLLICFDGPLVITPKIEEFPDASMVISIRRPQEKIKAEILELFKAMRLLVREEVTDDGINIITAYDYSELKVERRSRRAAYLVQIPPTNKDGHCDVRITYLIESKGDREKTWSVTEEDLKATPKQLQAITERVESIATSK
jgi:hypothetical protein